MENINFIQGVGIEKEDIANLESAKLLKSIGYSNPTHWYWLDMDLPYVEKGLKRVKVGERRINHNRYECVYSAPTRKDVDIWLNRQHIPMK